MRRLALLVTLLFALPLAAQTEAGIIVGHSDSGATDAGGTALSFHHGRGVGATLDHRFAERASVELAAMWLRSDGTLGTEGASAGFGTLKLLPISATARWHFAPRGEHLDPYVGAGAAYVKASDLTSGDLDALGIGRVAVESKACWLANAGVAYDLRSVSVVVDGKYFDYRPQSGSPPDRIRLNLKPVVISAGLRFKL